MALRWQHTGWNTAHAIDTDHTPVLGEQLRALCGVWLEIGPRDVGRESGVPCTACDRIEEDLDNRGDLDDMSRDWRDDTDPEGPTIRLEAAHG